MSPNLDRLVAVNTLSSHPEFDDHEMVVRCEDPASGLRAFVAIHDTTLGSGMGGCRMKLYASEDEALTDVLRLSRGMTYKYAAAGLAYGGAKAVVIDDAEPSGRDEKLLAFARFVERLDGRYTTAEDAGIATADIRLMRSETSHIRNLPLEDTGDGALCTAWGVLHGIEAALAFRGLGSLSGRTVAVEGLGKVGMTLCSLLRSAGSNIVVHDIDGPRIAEAAERYGAIAVAGRPIHAADADVYAPCALGGVLNRDTIPEIRASIVAGAANNQLSDPAQDASLQVRDITYCPDYVVNAGGVLSVADRGVLFDRGDALKRVAAIGETTRTVLELARSQDLPTGAAADRYAETRLGRTGG